MATTPVITLRTNFTPPISFNPFSKAALKETGFSLTSLLQPSIDGNLPIIGDVHYAPNGEPSGYGLFLLVAAGGLALYGAYKLFTNL